MMKQFFALTVVGSALFAPSAFSQQSAALPSDQYQTLFRKDRAQRGVNGAASCAGCHSGMSKGQDGHPQNEYREWQGKRGDGPHYNSFNILNGQESQSISRVLHQIDGLGKEAFKRADCLRCHGLGHAAKQQSKKWNEREPVSCEACHGHAGPRPGINEGWQTLHTYPNWNSKDSEEWLTYGMYDTRDVLLWAENCLECHHGTATARFSHSLLGAGHPDIPFELFGDLSGVPEHWRWERSYLKDVPDEGIWQFARIWAVGQAITLRETMRALVRWSAKASERPDFALFNCISCHHAFARNEAGSTPPPRSPVRLTRASGEPAWNGASWAACKQLAYALMPESQAKFDTNIQTLFDALSLSAPDREAVRAAASDLAMLADALAHKANTTHMDLGLTRKLLVGIAEDYEYIGAMGPYGGHQAFRAFEALYLNVWLPSGQKVPEQTQAEIRENLQKLQAAVYDRKDARKPSISQFNYAQFRTAMEELARLWKDSGAGS